MTAPTSSARIFDRFLAIRRECPRAPAIVHANGVWTYDQLERGSRALARELLGRPAANEVVAIYGRRSPELVLGMIACMRAGLTFAVLDTEYPVERIDELLAVAKPGRILKFAHDDDPKDSRTSFPGSHALPMPPQHLLIEEFEVGGFLHSDVSAEGLDQVSPASIAYLLFTSGTTGAPKCIATAHHPLVHFVDWYAKTFAIDAASRVSMLSGLGHDPLLRDVFVPLSLGAELHVPAPATLRDSSGLFGWLAESAVTHVHVTPHVSQLICGGRRERPPLAKLELVLSGGDLLHRRLVGEVNAVAPRARVVNVYGASETPQAMGFHVFDAATDGSSEIVPIGRGIDGAQILVLDDSLRLAQLGERGQIAVRTKFLSAGYVGDATATSAAFVAHPDGVDPTDLLYLTGDVGHFRADGAVVAEGRKDDQVKIRGYRVELAEVVQHLERIPFLGEAVVLPEESSDGENRLIGFVVDRLGIPSDGAAATRALKAELAVTLPDYMIPSQFVWLERLPLLPNGKNDRSPLRSLRAAAARAEAPPPSPSPPPGAFAAAWKSVRSLWRRP